MLAKDNELQEMALADARKIYSRTAIDHFSHPRNLGVLPDDDGYARITSACGDTMEIWLRIRQGTITKAHFMTDGSCACVASGSVATVLVIGKTLAEAQLINPQSIMEALNGLPEDNKHCALLAAHTLNAAIQNYLVIRREPRKKNS